MSDLDKMDHDFYISLYPDVISYCNNDINWYDKIDKHFRLYGKKEGRICNAEQLKNRYNNNLNIIKEEYDNFKNQNFLKVDESKLNILIRTSNRPEYFKKCIDSVISQNYTNYEIFVCYDDIKSYDYIKNCNLNITSFYINIESDKKYKFNLYCNYLMDYVNEGFIIFLDDDDEFSHNKVFNIINENIQNEDTILIWKFMRPDKLIYPSNINKINLGEIDTTSVCFNSKFKNLSKWGDNKNGDYHFYKDLFSKATNIVFINYILTKTIYHDKICNS